MKKVFQLKCFDDLNVLFLREAWAILNLLKIIALKSFSAINIKKQEQKIEYLHPIIFGVPPVPEFVAQLTLTFWKNIWISLVTNIEARAVTNDKASLHKIIRIADNMKVINKTSQSLSR